MKESRNKRGGRKAAPVLETRRPRHPKEARKSAPRKAPDADVELLAALQAWARSRAGETASDDALSVSERPGRFRLKGALDRVFRHYARLSWLAERQGLQPTPDWLWGASEVVLGKIEPEAAAKYIAVTTADIPPTARLLARMRADTLTHPEMPESVALECPKEFYDYFSKTFGDQLKSELIALNLPAPLDLRVNALKATREALAENLASADIQSSPTPYAPLGLRARGRPDLAALNAFADGLFDMQDEGSQLVAAMTDARAGQQVLDFCAGAGGKTMALAAAMENRGHLVAADVSQRRLTRAKLRLKRAGVENAERVLLTGQDDDPFLKKRRSWFDRVLVDAPCSGSGSWRRHPETKWRGAGDMTRLNALQDAILARAAGLVKRGGRLIYATCSLLPQENEARVEAFLKAHEGFRLLPADAVWRDSVGAPWPDAQAAYLKLTPAKNGTDGFFAAVLERVA